MIMKIDTKNCTLIADNVCTHPETCTFSILYTSSMFVMHGLSKETQSSGSEFIEHTNSSYTLCYHAMVVNFTHTFQHNCSCIVSIHAKRLPAQHWRLCMSSSEQGKGKQGRRVILRCYMVYSIATQCDVYSYLEGSVRHCTSYIVLSTFTAKSTHVMFITIHCPQIR